jgi:hypothetical protein
MDLETYCSDETPVTLSDDIALSPIEVLSLTYAYDETNGARFTFGSSTRFFPRIFLSTGWIVLRVQEWSPDDRFSLYGHVVLERVCIQSSAETVFCHCFSSSCYLLRPSLSNAALARRPLAILPLQLVHLFRQYGCTSTHLETGSHPRRSVRTFDRRKKTSRLPIVCQMGG